METPANKFRRRRESAPALTATSPTLVEESWKRPIASAVAACLERTASMFRVGWVSWVSGHSVFYTEGLIGDQSDIRVLEEFTGLELSSSVPAFTYRCSAATQLLVPLAACIE